MINGYLLINKPSGTTSHDVVDVVRKISGQREVGHAGTLDPLAEGLLILLLGQYTKRSNEFMKFSKEYFTTFALGKVSDTHDAEGKIEEKKDFKIPDRSEVENILNNFRGEIEQIPPQHSAIKVGGKKAYNEARAGRIIALPSRKVNIYKLDVEDYIFPNLSLRILCSSGTYIRSLARDIGESLSTGAIMSYLKRTKIGEYNLEDSINLENLNEETLRRCLAHRQS